MRLLLDQGFGRSTARLLGANGHDAIHVCDRGMESASDSKILDLALAERRIVVTMDADFHALLALAAAEGPSVIRIRIEGLKHDAAAALIDMVTTVAESDLERGAMVSVEHDRVRIRHLPLIRNTGSPPTSP